MKFFMMSIIGVGFLNNYIRQVYIYIVTNRSELLILLVNCKAIFTVFLSLTVFAIVGFYLGHTGRVWISVGCAN